MIEAKCEDVTKFEQRLKDEILQWKKQREQAEAIYANSVANMWKKAQN